MTYQIRLLKDGKHFTGYSYRSKEDFLRFLEYKEWPEFEFLLIVDGQKFEFDDLEKLKEKAKEL